MNVWLQEIINSQRYDGYDLNFTDIDFISDEHLLFRFDGNVCDVVYPNNVPESPVKRWKIIAPYFYNYFSNLSSNKKPCKFFISLDDIERKPYPRHIPILCLAKEYYLNNILIPSIDFFNGTMMLVMTDVLRHDIPYHQKIDGSCFIGASTGPKNINNTRIRYCMNMKNNFPHIAKIDNLCQIDKHKCISIFNTIDDIVDKSMNIKEQLKYKILVNIDGNGPTYSRLYWQIMSNSIPVYIEPNLSYRQFFDHPNIFHTYIVSSIDSSKYLFDSIINNSCSINLDNLKNRGRQYSYELFKDYYAHPKEYLMNIVQCILDRLINRNSK